MKLNTVFTQFYGEKMNIQFKTLSLGLIVITGNAFAMDQGQPMSWLTKRSIDFRSASSLSKDFIFNHPYMSGLGLGIAGFFTYKLFTRTNPAAQYKTLLAKNNGSKGKAFHEAIEKNDLTLAKHILSQEEPLVRVQLANYSNPFEEHKHNSLVKSITQRNKAMVELLLANEANPQAAVEGSINAIDYAEVLRVNNNKMQDIYNKLKLAIPVPKAAAQAPVLTAGAKALIEELEKLEPALNQ